MTGNETEMSLQAKLKVWTGSRGQSEAIEKSGSVTVFQQQKEKCSDS